MQSVKSNARNCAYCAGPIGPGRRPQTRFCSANCRVRSHRGAPLPVRDRTCRHCKAPLVEGGRSSQRYCGAGCRIKAHRRRKRKSPEGRARLAQQRTEASRRYRARKKEERQILRSQP